jgi:hypothetical protein
VVAFNLSIHQKITKKIKSCEGFCDTTQNLKTQKTRITEKEHKNKNESKPEPKKI